MRRKSTLAVFAAILFALQNGAWAGGRVESGYELGDTPAQERINFSGEPTVIQTRSVVNIPLDYGKIISVQPDAAGTAFWFEAKDGKVRNVVVKILGPILVERTGQLE